MRKFDTVIDDVSIREENFAQRFVETGNGARAYRECYNPDVKYATSQAAEILRRPHVRARVIELREMAAELHGITIGNLLDELEDARQEAQMVFPAPNVSAMVAATMGKAKLLGYDKQLVEHTGKGGEALVATVNFITPERRDG